MPLYAFWGPIYKLMGNSMILGYLFDTKWSEKIKGYEKMVYIAILVASFVELFLGYKWRGKLASYMGSPVILLALLVFGFNWAEGKASKK